MRVLLAAAMAISSFACQPASTPEQPVPPVVTNDEPDPAELASGPATDQAKGPPADPNLLVPGKGLRDVLFGESTPTDVLERYGASCVADETIGETESLRIRCSSAGAKPAIPDVVEFERGKLRALIADSSNLHLRGGIAVGALLADVQRVFGPPGAITSAPSGDVHHYPEGLRIVFDERGLAIRIIVEAAGPP